MTEHTTGLNGALIDFFRAEMAAQRITQPQLAALADMTVVSLQRYLAGKRGMDVAVVEKIANALGLTGVQAAVRAEAARDERETRQDRRDDDTVRGA